MVRSLFKKLVGETGLLHDGATGTELQKRGMPAGVCPERWVLEHPDALREIQGGYAAAGSDIVYTCTFGGNRAKLSEFGLGDRAAEINRRLALLSREAVSPGCLVGGDLAPTGGFIRPMGELPFEECVDIYKEQARGLLEGGVDLFVMKPCWTFRRPGPPCWP
jgi:5-methyltetrahydrofolate--homocysteine methyltransferase